MNTLHPRKSVRPASLDWQLLTYKLKKSFLHFEINDCFSAEIQEGSLAGTIKHLIKEFIGREQFKLSCFFKRGFLRNSKIYLRKTTDERLLHQLHIGIHSMNKGIKINLAMNYVCAVLLGTSLTDIRCKVQPQLLLVYSRTFFSKILKQTWFYSLHGFSRNRNDGYQLPP